MIKRVLWLGIGLAVGALVVRAVTKKVHAVSPTGLAASARDTAGGVVGSVRNFIDDVRVNMAEREDQLHHAFSEGIALDDDLESPEDFDDFELRER